MHPILDFNVWKISNILPKANTQDICFVSSSQGSVLKRVSKVCNLEGIKMFSCSPAVSQP